MVSTEAARTAAGILGNIIAVTLFMSPLPTFVRIWKKGSVEQYSPIPYLATFINCGLWVLYGLPFVHPDSLLVITVNGYGLVVEIVYLAIFLRFSDKKKRLRVLLIVLLEAAALAVIALLVLTLTHTTKLRSTIIGSLAMVGNVMMYASPLSVMKLVITTKSVEFMPLFLSVASTANGICWTTYALIRFDPYIAAPNGLGTLFGVAQLVLYAAYYKSTQRLMMDRKNKLEMDFVAPDPPTVSEEIKIKTVRQTNNNNSNGV